MQRMIALPTTIGQEEWMVWSVIHPALSTGNNGAINKTAANNLSREAAQSGQVICAGQVSIEAQIGNNQGHVTFGLTSSRRSIQLGGFTFSMRNTSGGLVINHPGFGSTFTGISVPSNSRFRIEIGVGIVRYFLNNSLVFSQAAQIVYPLVAAVLFSTSSPTARAELLEAKLIHGHNFQRDFNLAPVTDHGLRMLQVLSDSHFVAVENGTNNVWADCGLAVSITPNSVASTIELEVSINSLTRVGGTDCHGYFGIFRSIAGGGETTVAVFASPVGLVESGSNTLGFGTIPFTVYDLPATLNTVTYTIRLGCSKWGASSCRVRMNWSGGSESQSWFYVRELLAIG